jgi:formate-dependent nitrite reductase membrane component NrfD
MPIVFLFSAMVSGIALVMLLYIAATWLRRKSIDLRCLDTIGQYLFYALLIDFSLEMLDLVHRLYEADESLKALDFMVRTRLWTSQVIVQIGLGTLLPIVLLALLQAWRARPAPFGAGRPGGFRLTLQAVGEHRLSVYAAAGTLTLIGILAMRWNVVIGGQLFSKSFLGYTSYKMDFATREGLLPAIVLMLLPFVILAVLVRVLPPWSPAEDDLPRTAAV